MTVSLTFFDSIKDNTTSKSQSFDSFEKFEKFLYHLSKKSAYKPGKDEKITPKCSPLITPAVYPKGSKRRNVNVEKWAGWAALDVDDYEGLPDDALKPFIPYHFVCYSTASSTRKKPKFRVIFPLSHDVTADKIKHFWYALNTEVNAIGDPQTKDLSRMYYIPGQYPNAYNFIFTHKGDILNPYELMEKHAYAEPDNNPLSMFPPEVQEEILNYRANQLTNNSKTWSSIHDCPYMPYQLVNEYRSLSGGGWYGKLYAIMCGIAFKALNDRYNISPKEIEYLIRQLDAETGNWYKSRPIEVEAQRAISHALKGVQL